MLFHLNQNSGKPTGAWLNGKMSSGCTNLAYVGAHQSPFVLRETHHFCPAPSCSGSATNIWLNKSGCPPFHLLLWALIIVSKLLSLITAALFFLPPWMYCPYNIHHYGAIFPPYVKSPSSCPILLLVLQLHRYGWDFFNVSNPKAVLQIMYLESRNEHWMWSPRNKTNRPWGSNSSRADIKNWWKPMALLLRHGGMLQTKGGDLFSLSTINIKS